MTSIEDNRSPTLSFSWVGSWGPGFIPAASRATLRFSLRFSCSVCANRNNASHFLKIARNDTRQCLEGSLPAFVRWLGGGGSVVTGRVDSFDVFMYFQLVHEYMNTDILV